MSKIVLLRGNSGSGKSTTAKALQRRLVHSALLISQDYVRREMLCVKDEPNNQAVDLLKNLVIYGSQNCDFVILEGILYADIYESLFKMIADVFTNQIYAYYFDLPFEETLKRHAQKNISHEYGEPEMKRWWRDKDYLVNIREKRLSMEMSLDETVELIYGDLFGIRNYCDFD